MISDYFAISVDIVGSIVRTTRPVAQLAEQRSPKPQVGGSSPSWPARLKKLQHLWRFLQETRGELRKVVWPTRRETVQTTLIVIVMALVSSLFLWGVDSMMLWIIKFLTG